MKSVYSLLGKAYGWLENVSCVLLFMTMLLAIANVVSRFLLQAPIFGTVEGICYLSMLVALFSMPAAEHSQSNIVVSIVTDMLPQAGRNLLETITDLISVGGCCLLAYELMGLAGQKFAKGDISADLKIPIGVITVVIAVGFGLIALATLIRLLLRFTGGWKEGGAA